MSPIRTVVFAASAFVGAGCGISGGGDVIVAPEPVVDLAETATADSTLPLPETTVSESSSTSSTTSSSSTTSATSSSTTSATSSSTTSTTTSSTTTSSTTTAPGPVYFAQPYTQYATAGPVALFHPADRVEIIGFHEAGHDGSQQQTTLDDVAPSVTLESRNRNTGSRTAADIVVPPEAEIRAPVTGTVIRGGTYVLYCDYSDSFVVIEPDSAPGWEVKMFHFDGLLVSVGDHVEAGVTVMGPHATPLPFESQVDEFTDAQSNPHVHVEVIDPSIPDIPSGSGGC